MISQSSDGSTVCVDFLWTLDFLAFCFFLEYIVPMKFMQVLHQIGSSSATQSFIHIIMFVICLTATHTLEYFVLCVLCMLVNEE